MKFPWSKPSACEVVEALFEEFTDEEKLILDGDDCAIPHMRSFLLEEVKTRKSNYSLEDAKLKMKHLFSLLGIRFMTRRYNDRLAFSLLRIFYIVDK